MTLREIVAAGKTNIKVGPWKAGKIPRADFPLAKSAYRLGNAYRWCIISFDAVGGSFKCAVIFNRGKAKYEAILAVANGTALRVLCSYQFHEGEPGWHCHAACGAVDALPNGIMRGPWIRRLPLAKKPHRRREFLIDSDQRAIQAALKRYQIEEKGPLL